jgi:hypothetical protein
MAIAIETDLVGWIQTLESFVESHPAPVAGLTELETMTNIIVSQARSYGPSLTTGGHLSAVTQEQAQQIAGLILKWVAVYKLDPALVVAGLSGESRCDPNAMNPNYQDAQPGEDANAAFHHCDIGIAQFDGATLVQATGIFADLAGLSYAEIKAKALDPDWAIEHFCAFVAKLFADTEKEVANDPALLTEVPAGDIRILATEAYNAGPTGAAHIAHTNGTAGNWSYGSGWINRYTTYAMVMKGQT